MIKIHVLYNHTYYKSKKATHGPHTQKVALHIAVLAASFITWPCPCKGRYFEVLVDKNAEVLDWKCYQTSTSHHREACGCLGAKKGVRRWNKNDVVWSGGPVVVRKQQQQQQQQQQQVQVISSHIKPINKWSQWRWICRCKHPETNIAVAPENKSSQKETSLPTIMLQVQFVSFREGKHPKIVQSNVCHY